MWVGGDDEKEGKGGRERAKTIVGESLRTFLINFFIPRRIGKNKALMPEFGARRTAYNGAWWVSRST